MPEYADAQIAAIAASIDLWDRTPNDTFGKPYRREVVRQVLDSARELAPATEPENLRKALNLARNTLAAVQPRLPTAEDRLEMQRVIDRVRELVEAPATGPAPGGCDHETHTIVETGRVGRYRSNADGLMRWEPCAEPVGDTPDPSEPARYAWNEHREDNGGPWCIWSDEEAEGTDPHCPSGCETSARVPAVVGTIELPPADAPVPARTAEEPTQDVIEHAGRALRQRWYEWLAAGEGVVPWPDLVRAVLAVTGTHQPEHPDLIDAGGTWRWQEGYFRLNAGWARSRDHLETVFKAREVPPTQAEPPMLAPDPAWPAEPATVEVQAEEDDR